MMNTSVIVALGSSKGNLDWVDIVIIFGASLIITAAGFFFLWAAYRAKKKKGKE